MAIGSTKRVLRIHHEDAKEMGILTFVLVTSIWAKTVDLAIFGLGTTFLVKKMRENKRRRSSGV